MIHESHTSQDSSTERPGVWKMSGDIFDEGETGPAKVRHRLGRTSIEGYSGGQSPRNQESPRSADELIARTGKEMRQFGRTDERVAYQTGAPRPASEPRPERPRRPRQTENVDDDFFDDPLGRSRGSGTIG